VLSDGTPICHPQKGRRALELRVVRQFPSATLSWRGWPIGESQISSTDLSTGLTQTDLLVQLKHSDRRPPARTDQLVRNFDEMVLAIVRHSPRQPAVL
jgi:hypothetical protein